FPSPRASRRSSPRPRRWSRSGRDPWMRHAHACRRSGSMSASRLVGPLWMRSRTWSSTSPSGAGRYSLPMCGPGRAAGVGSRGPAWDAREDLGLDVAVVRGAVLAPEVRTGAAGESGQPPAGISLVPDPALLLGQLRRLAPRVSRVTVVYSDPQGQPLIDRAVEV